MLANREVANIYQYPTVINAHTNDEVVALGDLHGNTAKFLHMLVSEGILDVDQSTYKSLMTLYKKSGVDRQFSRSDLDSFNELLAKIKIKDPCPSLRLIGDDLADRGKNDLLTLLVFQKLKQSNVNFDVIASNHGVEFLKQYVVGINDPELVIYYTDTQAFFGASLYGLRKNIDDGVMTQEEVESVIQTSYLPKVKLLSHEIGDDNTISIYSHAPINQAKIIKLAELFDIEYKGETVNDLAATIDKINNKFSEVMSDIAQLHALMFNDPAKFSILDNFINDRYAPGELNRYDDIITEPITYDVINIHGHVGEVVLGNASQIDNWKYVNLDSNLGKDDTLSRGRYPTYVSSQPLPSVQHKPPPAQQPTQDTASIQRLLNEAHSKAAELTHTHIQHIAPDSQHPATQHDAPKTTVSANKKSDSGLLSAIGWFAASDEKENKAPNKNEKTPTFIDDAVDQVKKFFSSW